VVLRNVRGKSSLVQNDFSSNIFCVDCACKSSISELECYHIRLLVVPLSNVKAGHGNVIIEMLSIQHGWTCSV